MSNSEESRGAIWRAFYEAKAFYLAIRSKAHTRIAKLAVVMGGVALAPTFLEKVLTFRQYFFDTGNVSVRGANPWPGVVIIFGALVFWLVAEANPAAVQASELEALNSASVDFDDRLERLEARA